MKLLRIFSLIIISTTLTQSLSAQLISLESRDHFQQLLGEKKPLIIDFFATWCGVCKRAEPMVIRLANQHKGVNFVKIDGDQFPRLKEEYHVRAFPTFIFLDAQGNTVHRIEGMDEKDMNVGLAKIRRSAEKIMDMKKLEPKPITAPIKKMEEEKKPTIKKETEKPMAKPEVKTMPVKTAGMDKNLVELESMAHLAELKAKRMSMVFDIYTTWCGPCKMMAPIIKDLAQEYDDVIFVTINAEKPGLESINKTYCVEAYPTFIFIDKEGKEVARHRGSGDAILLKSKLGKISSKQTKIIVVDEKDMRARGQAQQKMMPQQPTTVGTHTMKTTAEKSISSRGKVTGTKKVTTKSSRRGLYRH